MVPYSDAGVAYVRGLSAVPRVGFDGGNRVRVRGALELPVTDRAGASGGRSLGGGASFGFGYAF